MDNDFKTTGEFSEDCKLALDEIKKLDQEVTKNQPKICKQERSWIFSYTFKMYRKRDFLCYTEIGIYFLYVPLGDVI